MANVAPLIHRQRSRESGHTGITFGEMFNRWLLSYAKPYYQEGTWRNYERMFHSYFDCFAGLDSAAIKRGDVQQWVARLAETAGPTTANRARELMRMVYNRCIEWEVLPDNYNPATKIRKFALKSRERFLQSNEIGPFLESVQMLKCKTTRDCLLFCLFTGQRLGNVRTARWENIDFRRGTWYIPHTKNGTSHTIGLTPEALELLKGRKEKATGPWVFPGRKGTGPVSRIETAWKKVKERSGLHDLRIHDLRRSHASWQAITGANISAISKTLNHLDLNSTAIYARLNVDDQRQASSKAIRALLEAAGVPPAAEDPEASREAPPRSNAPSAPAWVSEGEAAKILSDLAGCEVSEQSLSHRRQRKNGPPYLRDGGTIRYDIRMLKAWAENHRTSDSAYPYRESARSAQEQ